MPKSRFLTILLLLAYLCVQAPALADMPLPTPLPGEVLSHEKFPFSQQFAAAQAGPEGSIYVFTQTSRWQLWPQDQSRLKEHLLEKFSLPVGPRLGYSETYPARYTGVSTAQGIWLLGPSIELIRPDGSRISAKLKWPRHQLQALALPDASVLAIGGYSWPESRDFSYNVKLERIWLDKKGAVQSEALPPIPFDSKGAGSGVIPSAYKVTLTGKGQVMLAGSAFHNQTMIFDPVLRTWRKLPGMTQARSGAALTLLPDGRIWATGGDGGMGTETSSELWNPRSEQWEKGPDLPVPMVNHQALLSERKDAVILAGGYYPSVLAWKMGKEAAFVAAQHASQRRLADVFLLPGERLALLGGRYARSYGEAWGQNTPGVSVIPLDLSGQGRRPPTWNGVTNGALIADQAQLWAIGGSLQYAHSGSEQNLSTRLVERIDLATGQVRSLPPLPILAGKTEAAWLKTGEILIHTSSPDMEQWVGTLDAQSGRLRNLPLPKNLMRSGMHLVGAHAGQGWLIAQDASSYRVASKPPYYTPGPRLQRQRDKLTGRVLTNGRVIVAGGEVESELVASRPVNCGDCPLAYIGYGPRLPSRRHEIFDPKSNSWEHSVPSRASGGPVAILADGRVAKLGELNEKKPDGGEQVRFLLEVSDAAGKRWRSLDMPSWGGVGVFKTTLFSINNDISTLSGALFLGIVTREGTSWWWLEDVDAPAPRWKPLGTAVLPYTFPAGEIDSGLRDTEGRKLIFQGGSGGVVVYAR